MTEPTASIRRSTDSTGLRTSFTLHLPPELADALETLATYLYDQAVAEGASMSGADYLRRELRALGADLDHIEKRFQRLSEEIGPGNEALREIAAMLGEVRYHLEEVDAGA